MAIVRTDVPMTSELCKKTIQKLAETYSFLEIEQLTTTAFGRPIYAIEVGDGDREVIFSAAHHANEWITATLLLKFLEDLAEAYEKGGKIYGVPAKNILKYTTMHLVPMVDPDGVDLVTGAIRPQTPEYTIARQIAGDFPDIPFPDGWRGLKPAIPCRVAPGQGDQILPGIHQTCTPGLCRPRTFKSERIPGPGTIHGRG